MIDPLVIIFSTVNIGWNVFANMRIWSVKGTRLRYTATTFEKPLRVPAILDDAYHIMNAQTAADLRWPTVGIICWVIIVWVLSRMDDDDDNMWRGIKTKIKNRARRARLEPLGAKA